MTEQELIAKAETFLRRFDTPPVALPLSSAAETITHLRGPDDWPDTWCGKPGIYYFVNNDEVVYIGRAVPSQGLGNRIGTHIAVNDDSDWGQVVTDGNTRVGMIPFDADDWHWLAALEVYLIDDPRPKFNKKF